MIELDNHKHGSRLRFVKILGDIKANITH